MSTATNPARVRHDIVRKGDGRIYVRTHNLANGSYAMLHRDYMKTVEEARAWIRVRMANDAQYARDNAENVIDSVEAP